ncbi:salicylate hydroxylase [Fusarium circinatum]|uniref:Salicylate hydroxylase n=1 Tax=Fusarium circinatum TaxID=48490 RepID=A0A8H5X9A3_FUSCI|nr:salicylate hydroxylase [Fusarium circinatum]
MTVKNTTNGNSNGNIKAAIIGGGPGGLGAAIALAKLSFVDWTLYEKKPEISETGGGISLQLHTWKMLEWNGSSKNIKPSDLFRSPDGISGQQRNGRTGELIEQSYHPETTPIHWRSGRQRRAKLQAALLKEVDESKIKLSKKLVGIEKLPSGRVIIRFEDGFTDEVDLLIAADGIRSSAYRTIISKADVKALGTIPQASTFWQNLGGRYVFTSPLGDDDFEVTARLSRSSEGQDQVSWGRPFDFSTLVHEYDGFCEPVRQVVRLAAKGETQEFALFSGPRLDRVVALDSVALIGDASHPLSGAFGAGAGFALEDVYTLTKTLEWAWTRGRGIKAALELYDRIRSPHYHDLYNVLDWYAGIGKEIAAEGLSVDDEIEAKVRRTKGKKSSWMYDYDIQTVVDDVLDSLHSKEN